MIKYWLTVSTLSAVMLVPSIAEVSAEKSKADQLYDMMQQCQSNFDRDISRGCSKVERQNPKSPCVRAASLALKICEHDAANAVIGKRL